MRAHGMNGRPIQSSDRAAQLQDDSPAESLMSLVTWAAVAVTIKRCRRRKLSERRHLVGSSQAAAGRDRTAKDYEGLMRRQSPG
jgi:hypothetical protein